MKKRESGITLVALVVTIIVLLILAAVSINLVLGDNGIITRARKASQKYEKKADIEQEELKNLDEEMDTSMKNKLSVKRISLDELEDEEEYPELKALKLKIKIEQPNDEVELPIDIEYGSQYDCTVDWGDGSSIQDVKNAEIVGPVTHIYINVGEYTITIEGLFERLMCYNMNQLIQVQQWGMTGLKNVLVYTCNNLTQIATPSRNSFINIGDFGIKFSNCRNLESIPEKLLANCPNVEILEYLFYSCEKITMIPERLFANCDKLKSLREAFHGCTAITDLPENLFANCLNLKELEYTFCACRSLTSIPERIFENCINLEYLYSTFQACTGVTELPQNLFTNCPNIYSFEKTFYLCTNLKGKPIELWNEGREQKIESFNGGGCYHNCTQLDGYENIPEDWKQVYWD